MTASLTLYRALMNGLSPFVPMIFRHRLGKGKEIQGRLNERQARSLPPRPDGQLIWMHGASIGESKLLLSLAAHMRIEHPASTLLFTSQTSSSAGIVASSLPDNALHQMAPIDSPAGARRFIEHWQPDLCVFAEGEVWPNLLQAARTAACPAALVNARMTTRTIAGWRKLPRAARSVFSAFDLILAADQSTASGLSQLTGRDVLCVGNLKTASLDRPGPNAASTTATRDLFGQSGLVLLGASTHRGEEILLLDTLPALPDDTRLILAPRHPERTDEIEALLTEHKLTYAKRSRGDTVLPDTRVLLADTFGEMDHWYKAADIVYLGGGSEGGPGGHNPLEPLSFGRPVISGPAPYNFADLHSELEAIGGVTYASTPEEVLAAIKAPEYPDSAKLGAYLDAGQSTLTQTLAALTGLLERRAT